MKGIATILVIAIGTLCADEDTAKYFWEPELSGGQAFIAYPRSIKSYRLAKYDIYFEGERYPVTELNLELTHGTVSFLAISDSEGKPIKPTLKEMAGGNFQEKRLPGSLPPEDIKVRGRDANRRARFLLDSPSAVVKLHGDLDLIFHIAFPW